MGNFYYISHGEGVCVKFTTGSITQTRLLHCDSVELSGGGHSALLTGNANDKMRYKSTAHPGNSCICDFNKQVSLSSGLHCQMVSFPQGNLCFTISS